MVVGGSIWAVGSPECTYDAPATIWAAVIEGKLDVPYKFRSRGDLALCQL